MMGLLGVAWCWFPSNREVSSTSFGSCFNHSSKRRTIFYKKCLKIVYLNLKFKRKKEKKRPQGSLKCSVYLFWYFIKIVISYMTFGLIWIFTKSTSHYGSINVFFAFNCFTENNTKENKITKRNRNKGFQRKL